jgi:two-component system, sensor histidine kinase
MLMSRVELAALARQCVARHGMQASHKGLALRTWVAPSLRHTSLHTDPVLLERVLGNLLGNALRYTQRGGVLLSLRRGGQGSVWLEVWDTGIGIEAEHLGHIFSPYYQVGNRERDRSKGLGLGLAIVRTSVDLLGLSLAVHSRPGRGSRFRLIIPAGQWMPHRPMASVDERPAGDAAIAVQALHGRRVLVIDDDPMVRHAMQTLLGSWGIELRMACHADDPALAAWCSEDWVPECILSDYRLPGPCQGIALLHRLLDHWPDAVGILQTGELAAQVQAHAEDAGFAVLFKPVAPALLASTLRAVLPER